MRDLFAKYGSIKSAIVMRDDQGKSKGFGFVNFEKPEEAEDAVTALNNVDVKGKTIYVGRAQKKAERELELRQKFEQMKQEQMAKYQGVNLYVKNLDDDVDDDKFRGIFSPFGTITSCKVMRDNKGVTKGFGFVCYANPEEATKAVTEMNGKIITVKPLYVALAQRKDIRRVQLEAQFAQRKLLPGARIPATGPMYGANGAPVFYPGAQPGFVYGGVMPRGRFPAPYQGMPNYVVVGGGRGQQMKNGGRGGMNAVVPSGQRRGFKGPAQFAQVPAQMQVMPALIPQGPIMPEVPVKLTSAYLASLSADDQKAQLGERLYPMIAKNQPELSGKITGMILESCSSDEMLQLLDNEGALNEKVEEALKVLQEHKE